MKKDTILTDETRLALGESGRQCTATNRDGYRCQKSALRGGFVCHLHGGKTPGVIEAAKRRLLAMVDPALDALFAAMQIGKCDHCGRSHDMNVVVRAAQIVLDRSGFHPSMTIETKADDPYAKWTAWLLPGQFEQMATWIGEAKERRMRGESPQPQLPPAPPEVSDAVLIEDVDGPPSGKPN